MKLTQSQRALALLIDIAALLSISYVTFGSIAPPLGDKGFWFYTALLSILVGAKLVTPFYVKPVDAVAYSVPAFVALMLSNQWASWPENARAAYIVATSVTVVVGTSAFGALLLNGLRSPRLQDLSNRLRLLVENTSTPAVLYCPIMIFAMLAYHYDSPKELVAVTIAMLATTAFSVGDLLIVLLRRARLALGVEESPDGLGTVAAYQQPGVYLLRSEAIEEGSLPAPILVRDALTGVRFAYAIDTVGREGGHLCRAIELSAATDGAFRDLVEKLSPNGAARLDAEHLGKVNADTLELLRKARSIVGLVAADSSVPRLLIEVTNNEELAVGRLVSAEFFGQTVLYQLVGGLTREEVVHQKNTYGYVRAQAAQVGIWQDRKFSQCRWLPDMHVPVRLEDEAEYEITVNTIGRFPQTNYTAEIGDINELVTHNTAILGILGVGKSMLAIELVERMLASGIKVICIDLTSQYSEELDDFYCEALEAESLNRIQDACQEGREANSEDPEHGGSLPHLKEAIAEDLAEFLCGDNPRFLKIYNPLDFAATRQENEPRSYQENNQWRRRAALYSVTPVQATQIITEAALACVSDQMSDQARVCLVFEEAHALVPEWNSVVVEGDKRAAAGTARAILQGRKYGLGCLLVTQRTANVTKTILNQCNTIFAMRTFDETGKEFLSNYLGREYSETLSSLPTRHAVFFGRASNCENPILIALNDQSDFRARFRAANPPPNKDELCRSETRSADEDR